jgi:hypothetical protein
MQITVETISVRRTFSIDSSWARGSRALKCLLSVSLLLMCLSGCALDPMIRDPFAELDAGQQGASLKQLAVGLIISDNTTQTLKFAADTNASFTVSMEGHPAIPDLNQKITDYKTFLGKTFKTMALIDKKSDMQTVPVDVVAILDMHFDEFGLSAFEKAAFSMKTIFMTPSQHPIAEVSGKGISERFGIIPGSKWQKYIEGAIEHAASEMGTQMLSSAPLIAYAKSNAGQSASFAQKSSATAVATVKSDIDELPAIKAKTNRSIYAIVIGIENYRQALPKAEFATHDAHTVTEYLTKVLGYPEENVIMLLNDRALKSDFTKYFEKWLGNNVEADSTVFIYYAGHGAPDLKSGSAYLVPYDGDPAFIDQTGYSLKRMYDALGKLPAKKIIVALDSSFSGSGGRSVIAKGARPLVMNLRNNVVLSKNMTVLSASSGDQSSSTYDEKGHGLFTYFMLKGIKSEDVAKQDGSIDFNDLFSYIKPQVERIARKQYNNEQTPQLIVPRKN